MAIELSLSKVAIGDWGIGHGVSIYCLCLWYDTVTNDTDADVISVGGVMKF
mgnify:CR=1 FL=1